LRSKDNSGAIKKVCARFVELCRRMGLLLKASVAIHGSKFKAVNNRDKNFTSAKIERRRKQLEESVSGYLSQLDTADLQDPSKTLTLKKVRIKEKLEKLKSEIDKLAAIGQQVLAAPGSADLSDRFRQPIDGDERPRVRCRRVQRADRRRHRASPDCAQEVTNVGKDMHILRTRRGQQRPRCMSISSKR
jgi:hypothetical protein